MSKILLLLFIISIVTYAQQPSVQYIKNSGQYYYGVGIAGTEQEASDAALANLTRNIAIIVSAEFQRNMVETNLKLEETVTSILNTYATATLKNVKTILTPHDGTIEVLHYIGKNEVEKIFEKRKKLIYDIFQKAEQFEKDLNLGYALKWYYFSIILMNSIPETNIEYNGINLVTEIPSRISTIIYNVKFTLINDRKISDQERELVFSIQSQSKPVQLIEFSFWSGSGPNNVRAIDGEGVVRLYGSSIAFDKLTIDIKYSYYESREEIKEVGELWNLVKRPTFTLTKYVNLKREDISHKELTRKTETKYETQKSDKKPLLINKGLFKLNLSNEDNCKVVNKIAEETLIFLELLNKSDLQSVKEFYSYDSFLQNRIFNLITYNKPTIVGDIIEADINKTLTGWELRKIKILNRYNSIKKQSSEYLILDFDESGHFNDLTYGVLDNVYNKVEYEAKNYGNDWINRQTILKFAEKYRTAFLCRDISTIDSMFADEAVIIVGRMLKKTNIKDAYQYLRLSEAQPDVKYMQYTKNEYLKNLLRLFRQTEDIFIGYSTLDVKRKNVEKVYGISMRQNYHSTNYADEGYLFLLIDFESKNPQIYVRAWQPSEWDENSLIKLSNFNINR